MGDEHEQEQPGGGSEAGGDLQKISLEDLMHSDVDFGEGGDDGQPKPTEESETKSEAEPEKQPEAAKEAETQPDAGAQAQTQAQPEDKPEPKQEAEDSALQALKYENEQLRRQMAETNQLLQQMLQQRAQPQPQQASGQETQTQPDLPAYEFNIPSEMQQLIDSEDAAERARGLKMYAQGIARAVHKTIRDTELPAVEKMMDERVSRTTQQARAQQEVERESERIRQDFFQAYPDLNNQVGHMVVGLAYQQEVQELQQKGINPTKLNWDAALRNKIGERARSILGQMRGGSASQPQPQPTTQQVPKRVPAQPGGGGGTRPAPGPKLTEEDEMLMDTVHGGLD